MSTVKITEDDPALAGEPIARDRSRDLLRQVMGLVAVAVGFDAPAPTSGASWAARPGWCCSSAPLPASSDQRRRCQLLGVGCGRVQRLAERHLGRAARLAGNRRTRRAAQLVD